MQQVVLIAARGLAHGKQRLSSVLDAPARSDLNRRWLEHVLAVVRSVCSEQVSLALVSPDPMTLAFAQERGAQAIAEPAPVGLNQALRFACAQIRQQGVRHLTVLPADLPYIEPDDVHALLEGATGEVLIAPDLAGRGTNGLRVPIGTAIGSELPFLFGPDSCLAHEQAALAAGVPVRFVNRRGLQIDIDTPHDLFEWQRRPGASTPQCKADALP